MSLVLVIKNSQMIISASILAASLLLYGYGQSYQIVQLSGERYLQVNKYTGRPVLICELKPGACFKWDGLVLKNEEDYFDARLEKELKKHGLAK